MPPMQRLLFRIGAMTPAEEAVLFAVCVVVVVTTCYFLMRE